MSKNTRSQKKRRNRHKARDSCMPLFYVRPKAQKSYHCWRSIGRNTTPSRRRTSPRKSDRDLPISYSMSAVDQEKKKKEMEDLDELLANMGIEVKQSEDNGTAGSSKKQKKKKNKSASAVDIPKTTDPPEVTENVDNIETPAEPETSLTPEQIRSKLEKTKMSKRKTNSKKSVEIAAAEAKARNKGKKGKKDGLHYNQVRLSVVSELERLGHRLQPSKNSLWLARALRATVV